MGDPATCEHDGMHWFAAPANEQGWRCVDCQFRPGEPPGFSPHHDRELINIKVGGILTDLHEAEIIYVSNGSEGAVMTTLAIDECRKRNVYDSVSIARILLELDGDDGHAAYWRGISEGILAGKDPRDRCACGQLATQYCNGKRACSYEHMQAALGRTGGEW
jgi:hypothetical protein